MSGSIGGKEAAKFGPKEFGKIDAGQTLVQIKGCKEVRKGSRWINDYG